MHRDLPFAWQGSEGHRLEMAVLHQRFSSQPVNTRRTAPQHSRLELIECHVLRPVWRRPLGTIEPRLRCSAVLNEDIHPIRCW